MLKRNRLFYFFIVILVIGLGLFSRTDFIPASIYPYLGDALYAMMFYFLIGFLFPNLSSFHTFLLSLGICFLIEITQLYQSDWIIALRRTQLGALILGHGFLWSDLLAYFVGSLVGFIVERKLLSHITYKL